MKAPMLDIWVYLAASPLLGLTITLLAYLLAMAPHRRCRMHPLTNPVLSAAALLVTLLLLTDTPYPTYFAGAQFVHQLDKVQRRIFGQTGAGFVQHQQYRVQRQCPGNLQSSHIAETEIAGFNLGERCDVYPFQIGLHVFQILSGMTAPQAG